MELTDATTDAIPDRLVQRLAQQAEGNPFYLEELVNFIGSRALDPSDAVLRSRNSNCRPACRAWC